MKNLQLRCTLAVQRHVWQRLRRAELHDCCREDVIKLGHVIRRDPTRSHDVEIFLTHHFESVSARETRIPSRGEALAVGLRPPLRILLKHYIRPSRDLRRTNRQKMLSLSTDSIRERLLLAKREDWTTSTT